MKRAAFGILILVLMTLTACGKDKMTAEGENEKGLAYYNSGDYETASALQLLLRDGMEKLSELYAEYEKNII